MAADYDFRRKPNEKGDEELQPLYPRIVSKGTIDCKRLFREISEASTFTEGDLAGIMVSLQEVEGAFDQFYKVLQQFLQ